MGARCFPAGRTCSDCPSPISTQSRGRCRPCAARHMQNDPEIAVRRAAARDAFFAKPETKRALAARLAVFLANMSDEERERRRAHGKAIVGPLLHTPEAKAKSLERRLLPEAQARRARTMVRTRLPWCPDELVPLYRELTRKGCYAAEARAAIEPMIPETEAHTARVLANHRDAQRIRAEREKAQAY